MAKDTYYFKHDCNARNDIKLIKVRRKYQMAGYGIYFAIVEMLREQDGHKLPMCDIEDIAFDLDECAEKVKSIIEDFGLFVIENGCFYSDSLWRRMSDYNDLKAKRVAAARKGGEASVKQRSTKRQPKVKQTLTVGQPLDYTTLQHNTLDYTTTQKTKELTAWAFDIFWEMYGKSVDKKKAFEKFERFEVLEWEKIFNHVPQYVKSTPDVQYRKNPTTYLNGKCWNDGVVQQAPSQQQFVLTPDLND